MKATEVKVAEDRATEIMNGPAMLELKTWGTPDDMYNALYELAMLIAALEIKSGVRH